MATQTIHREDAARAAFRDSILAEEGSAGTAQRLCETGLHRALRRAESLPPDPARDRLVYVASGAVKLTALRCLPGARRSQPAGERGAQILAFHFAGDLVSVLRQSERDFQLQALCDAELLVFPAERFLDIAESEPAVIRSVLARSFEALQRSRGRMMQLGHKSARQRVADFLVSIAERLCGPTCETCAFALPMSRRDIADSLGLTFETVSRQFTELREDGLIVTQGRSNLHIPDIAMLRRQAGRAAGKPANSQT